MSDDDKITLATIVQERYRNVGRNPGQAKPRRPQKPCQIDGCSGWSWARGYCDHHYQKLKREGVIKATRIVGDPVSRFHASYTVNPVSGCWEWHAWTHAKGYGILCIGGKSKKIRAHRFSWELHHGPIPDDLDVLHHCDNRKCCHPDHLFLGDASDNMRDCVVKGRHSTQIGTFRLKITPPMALNIRIMYARGLPNAYKTKPNPLGVKNLSSIYGVDQQTISAILKGNAHIPG